MINPRPHYVIGIDVIKDYDIYYNFQNDVNRKPSTHTSGSGAHHATLSQNMPTLFWTFQHRETAEQFIRVVINSINYSDAQRTANMRGYVSERDRIPTTQFTHHVRQNDYWMCILYSAAKYDPYNWSTWHDSVAAYHKESPKTIVIHGMGKNCPYGNQSYYQSNLAATRPFTVLRGRRAVDDAEVCFAISEMGTLL